MKSNFIDFQINLNLGKRLSKKQSEMMDLFSNEIYRGGKASNYLRLSTHEQVRNSRFSLARQRALKLMANEDGYQTVLTAEEENRIRSTPNYPGYYWDGDLLVIDADLGLTGTKGKDYRPGLSMLIHSIQTNLIETIYVVDVTRLFRDSDLIDAPEFAKLCRDHNVIIVSEG